MRLTEVLERHLFIAKRLTVGDAHNVRVRLAGAVRVMDEISNRLLEARNHLASGRVRAAGCIAGVELERALKELCSANQAEVRAKLPTIAAYNDALNRGRSPRVARRRRCSHARSRDGRAVDIAPASDRIDNHAVVSSSRPSSPGH